jgi:S-DNA-T family DNA segregation ATPase FtsK/SpoIIIE
MSQAKYKKTIEMHIPLQLKRRLREGGLIITGAIALFLFLALVTYHSSDPSWSHSKTAANIANSGGYVGAWLADILFCAFGYLAYVFPIMLIYAAWLPFQYIETDNSINYALFLLRTLGFLLILLAGSSLAGLYFV